MLAYLIQFIEKFIDPILTKFGAKIQLMEGFEERMEIGPKGVWDIKCLGDMVR